MKTAIKNPIKHFWLILPAILAMLVWTAGCAALVHHPDPLAGWQIAFKEEPDQAIVKDNQDYLQKLSPDERKFAHFGQYFQDGTGQHAVEIIIGLNGTWWRHVLIYDKNGKRIKVIKYSTGGYRS